MPKRRNEYGDVLEERRNYKLYVSGIDNSNLDFSQNNNNYNNRNIISYYKKENHSFDLSKYKYYNVSSNNKGNDYIPNSKKIITKNYSFIQQIEIARIIYVIVVLQKGYINHHII